MLLNLKNLGSFLIWCFLYFSLYLSYICIIIDEILQSEKLIGVFRGYYGKSQIVFEDDGVSDNDVFEVVKKSKASPYTKTIT